MSTTADILVVGLGAVGSAALYQASKLGVCAIGIDRFAPPHDQGSSHGDTRITRQAIGEGKVFVPLVLRSHEIWRELEAATGRSLMVRNGCLVLASKNTPGNHHGSSSFVQDTIDAAHEFDIPHQVLNADEIAKQYPQLRLRGDEIGYVEPGAGFLRPEACIEAQLTLARQMGAQIVTQEVVQGIKPSRAAVEVRTGKNNYSAGTVIVAAGSWIPNLLGPDYARYFKVYRQMLCWFRVARNQERFAPERFPVFIWITGNRPRDMMYGFPEVDASGGVKIATEQYEATVDPDAVPRDVHDSDICALYNEYIAPRFPDVSGECLRATTCLYTVTPDAKFIVDRFRDYHNVVFASACSGHGFKHSAALGEALVQQLLQQPTRVDVSPFALQRFHQ
ncbi:MAG TPA: N-methyl-L-tryptophan oxidase [Terriglobales bacterium]|nr:N-methyl-L-tryptophan oxidase [Terriglobales bacterium]